MGKYKSGEEVLLGDTVKRIWNYGKLRNGGIYTVNKKNDYGLSLKEITDEDGYDSRDFILIHRAETAQVQRLPRTASDYKVGQVYFWDAKKHGSNQRDEKFEIMGICVSPCGGSCCNDRFGLEIKFLQDVMQKTGTIEKYSKCCGFIENAELVKDVSIGFAATLKRGDVIKRVRGTEGLDYYKINEEYVVEKYEDYRVYFFNMPPNHNFIFDKGIDADFELVSRDEDMPIGLGLWPFEMPVRPFLPSDFSWINNLKPGDKVNVVKDFTYDTKAKVGDILEVKFIYKNLNNNDIHWIDFTDNKCLFKENAPGSNAGFDKIAPYVQSANVGLIANEIFQPPLTIPVSIQWSAVLDNIPYAIGGLDKCPSSRPKTIIEKYIKKIEVK